MKLTRSNKSFDVGHIHFDVTTTTSGTETNSYDLGTHLRFEDAGPSITAGTAPTGSLTVDESGLATGTSPDATLVHTATPLDFSGAFNVNFNSDTPGSTEYDLSIAANGTDFGLDLTNGEAVLLFKDSVTGDILGRTTLGSDVFKVSVDFTGNVSLDLYQALHQDSETGTPDDSVSMLSGKIGLTVTATDRDGDAMTSSSVDVGSHLNFKDDGPAIGPVPNATTSNTSGSSVTSTAFLAPDGADGGTTTITAAAAITGLHVTGLGTTEVKYLDAANNTIYDLKLLSDTQYQFTVVQEQTSPPETLNFSAIKSGSPTEFLDVSTSGGHVVHFDGLYWGADNPGGAGATLASLIAGDLNNGPADDLNPDNLGFGVKNGQASQIIQNEGFFFNDLDANGNPLSVSNLTFDVAQIGKVAHVTIEQWLFNGTEMVDYSSRQIDLSKTNQPVIVADTGANMPGTTHDVAGESFTTGYVRFTYDGGDTNSGVRIINFTTQIATQVADQNIDFKLTNTDGDLDTAVSNTFTVTVDNPNTAAHSDWHLV